MNSTNRSGAAALATETADAYSFNYYGPRAWAGCCAMLLARGYNAVEAAAIMRSVLTRLAHDGKQGRRANHADLARLLDSTSDVQDLVDELVVNINTEDLIEAQQAQNMADTKALMVAAERKARQVTRGGLRLVWSRPDAS